MTRNIFYCRRNGQRRRHTTFAIALAVSTLAATAAVVGEREQIRQIVIASSIDARQREEILKPLRAFYDFWNSDDDVSLRQAIGDTLVDQTLPLGRPQGPE